jgi:hypothetical protein
MGIQRLLLALPTSVRWVNIAIEFGLVFHITSGCIIANPIGIQCFRGDVAAPDCIFRWQETRHPLSRRSLVLICVLHVGRVQVSDPRSQQQPELKACHLSCDMEECSHTCFRPPVWDGVRRVRRDGEPL